MAFYFLISLILQLLNLLLPARVLDNLLIVALLITVHLILLDFLFGIFNIINTTIYLNLIQYILHMAKIKENRIKRIIKEMGIIKDFFDVDYILFLFGFKPSVLIFSTEKNNKENEANL